MDNTSTTTENVSTFQEELVSTQTQGYFNAAWAEINTDLGEDFVLGSTITTLETSHELYPFDEGGFDLIIGNEVITWMEVIIVTILCGLMSASGLVANVINVVVFFHHRALSTSSNVSLLALAVSDIGSLVPLLGNSINYAIFFLNKEVSPFLTPQDATEIFFLWPHIMFVQISSWITVYIALERCLSVIFPLKVRMIFSAKRSFFVVSAIALVLTLSFVPIYATTRTERVPDFETNTTKVVFSLNADQFEIVDASNVIQSIVLRILAVIVVFVCTQITVHGVRMSSSWRIKRARATCSDNPQNTCKIRQNDAKSSQETTNSESDVEEPLPDMTNSSTQNEIFDRSISQSITNTTTATSTDVSDIAATSTDISDNAATSTDISDNAATSTDISDNAATSTDISDNAVTSTEASDNAVTSTDVSDNAATSTDISDNASTSTDASDNAVTSTDISDNAVTSTDASDNAATSTDVSDNAVTSTDASDNAASSTDASDNAASSTDASDNAASSTDASDIATTSTTASDIAATSTIASTKESSNKNFSKNNPKNTTPTTSITTSSPTAPSTEIRENRDTNTKKKKKKEEEENNKSRITTINSRSHCNSPSHQPPASVIKERRLVKLITMISAIFVVCNMPEIVGILTLIVVQNVFGVSPWDNLIHLITYVQFLFEAINASINIFVYYSMSTNYRLHFRRLFRMN